MYFQKHVEITFLYSSNSINRIRDSSRIFPFVYKEIIKFCSHRKIFVKLLFIFLFPVTQIDCGFEVDACKFTWIPQSIAKVITSPISRDASLIGSLLIFTWTLKVGLSLSLALSRLHS